VIKARTSAIKRNVDSTLDPTSEAALGGSPSLSAGASSARLRSKIQENYEFIWRSLRRLGVPQASVEDAAQQVLVVFARRIDDIHPGAERSFLFATATRVAADYRKKQARSREDADSEGLDAHPSFLPPADQMIDEGRARELLDWVLAAMPLDLRTVFILFEIENITMAQIAEMLALRPGTVASRLRRARALFDNAAARLQRGPSERRAR
jgi:RNA polymerase sigma-70 factor, ECF subfamily